MIILIIKFFFILCLLFIFIPLILIISILIKIDSTGPVIHWSKRIGLHNNVFYMPKFRTMTTDTPQIASHLMEGKQNTYMTRIGFFLRKYSLDELPQIYSIIKGDMNIVGPRPALFNQKDLIDLRTKKNIHLIKPGITGYAQVNGRDLLSISEKVELDEYYFKKRNLFMDFKILIKTSYVVIKKIGITH